MKIRILVDVYQASQIASANVVECGEFKSSIYPISTDQKRYEVMVEVPHTTDAEPLEGTIREVTGDDSL